MEEIARLQASRRGHKAHVTRVLKKVNEVINTETHADKSMALASLNTALEQLTKKKDIIRELDTKIAAEITDPTDLEAEIFESEEINYELEENISHIRKYIELSALPSHTQELSHPSATSSSSQQHTTQESQQEPPQQHTTQESQQEPPQQHTTHESPQDPPQQHTAQESPQDPPQENTAQGPSQQTPQENTQNDPNVSPPIPMTVNPNASPFTPQSPSNPSTTNALPPGLQVSASSNPPQVQNTCRLPKLSLPVFSGNPLHWQSFWDSFDSAVHSNSSLNGVQRFNYLKAQLKGDALQAITGFPLTNSNYEQAITLLKSRFGQPHKIINAHMHSLLEIPAPNEQLESFQGFYDTLETHIRGLASIGKSQETYGDLLVPIILGKLPNEFRKNLAREHGTLDWTIDQLRSAIQKELRILEAGQFVNSQVRDNQQPKSTVTSSFHTQSPNLPPLLPKIPRSSTCAKSDITCLYCNGKHHPTSCKVITDPQKRYEIVRKENRCFNCLGRHRVAICKSTNRCQVCKRKHHTSLCNAKPNDSDQKQNGAATEQSKEQPSVHATVTPITPTPINSTNINLSCGTTCLLKTAIATVCGPKFRADANILFDEGAQRSFIQQKLVNQLQLVPTRKETIHLSAFGAANPAVRQLDVVTIHLMTDSDEKLSLDVLVVPDIATPIQNHLPSIVPNLEYLKGLKLAHPVSSDERFEISLLIGVDYYWQLVQDEIVRGDGPVAVKSKLGYLLSGPINSAKPSIPSAQILNVMINHNEEEFDLERFWTVESLGIAPPTINDEHKNQVQEYQSTSITRDKDGAYIAAFPWKKDHPPLPSNYKVCERRTRSLARRLAQSPDLLTTYGEIIADQEKRGFIEQVKPQQHGQNLHYIPHHPVIKDSSTTPVRIVYDCSCRQSTNAPSLNDCLHTGPPLLTDMCSILLRFRTHAYGFSTDIEKAFLHVRLNEQDRDFTRFLWLSNPRDPESPFTTYRFKAVLFGSSSSPFMLNATLHHHLDNHNTTITQDMKDNLYVDNLISGCDTEADAINYYDKARSTMSLGNFNLRSWASNSSLLQARAADDSTNEKSESVNILGLKWKPTSDKLTLAENSGSRNTNAPTTKRRILQQSAKIYDPLGLLSPVTVRARILLQDLWRRKLPWDTPVDNDLERTWSTIAADIEELVNEYATLPRQYFPELVKQEDNIHLHVFSDASTVAYGAVAFLQRENDTSFVMAKTRVAPLKTRTLPQLELMAALIGARLARFIHNTLEKRFPNLCIHLWSDSQIVLHWLSSKKTLPQFVANRVKEINQLYPSTSWRYCPTSDNPADLLTRGITSTQLRSSSTWLHGPPWLTSKSHWPTWNPKESPLLSTQALVTTTLTNNDDACNPPSDQPGLHHIIDVSKDTKLFKLIRRTAYILRFVNTLVKRNPCQSGPLTTKELREAERKWIQNVQALAYGKEIANLQSKHNKRSPLVRQLRLFLDASGLLRCGGRIHNAPLSESAKFPYLLPPKHPFTELVIQDAHQNQLHAGVNSTVTALRQKFWIPAARQSVRKVLRRCVNCRKVVGNSYPVPDSAPLPKSRIHEVVPFKVTGIDFTGALFVNNTDGSETKVYICLFTCATSRAIHLEIVTDLTEETFIQAFRRFASRKSLPKRIISDNASTYLSAADELRQLFQSPSLKKAFSDRGIEWEFIPKRAPWYGGFWERLIGMTKTVIKKVLGRARISLIALQTLVTEIEAILNDRPLTYVSSDLNDLQPLTPAHLLYGRRITSLPYPDVDEDEIEDPEFMDSSEARKRAKSQALRLKHFETRWKKEYLTSLREFHKSTGNNVQSVRVGEVVLVHSDNPRHLWRMAIIESLIRGKDGLIRAANLRTSNGKTNRPITKLYPLELVDNSYESSDTPVEQEDDDPKEIVSETPRRPVRNAAKKASQRILAWAETLRGPPEDVVN